MPDIRERNDNKIKGRRDKSAEKTVRRQLTAKYRKELAHRNKTGGDRPEVEATDQVSRPPGRRRGNL